jgi:hypothetical protein
MIRFQSISRFGALRRGRYRCVYTAISLGDALTKISSNPVAMFTGPSAPGFHLHSILPLAANFEKQTSAHQIQSP